MKTCCFAIGLGIVCGLFLGAGIHIFAIGHFDSDAPW